VLERTNHLLRPAAQKLLCNKQDRHSEKALRGGMCSHDQQCRGHQGSIRATARHQRVNKFSDRNTEQVLGMSICKCSTKAVVDEPPELHCRCMTFYMRSAHMQASEAMSMRPNSHHNFRQDNVSCHSCMNLDDGYSKSVLQQPSGGNNQEIDTCHQHAQTNDIQALRTDTAGQKRQLWMQG